MEIIRFFSGHSLPLKNEATPIGEEIRVYLDGEEVCAIMGEMPNEIGQGWSSSMVTALGNLAAELDSKEDEISWLKEGPVYAVIMSEGGPLAQGDTPIDALISLAKIILGMDWEPNLEA